MLKHHPSAREDMTAGTPEPSQKRRARKISTELLAAKLAEGNDAPWEGTRCDLEDSGQGWAAGQGWEQKGEMEVADFPGISADRAADLQGHMVKDRELNKHTSTGAAQDFARETRARPEACSSATVDAAPQAKRLWKGLCSWPAHLCFFQKRSQA